MNSKLEKTGRTGIFFEFNDFEWSYAWLNCVLVIGVLGIFKLKVTKIRERFKSVVLSAVLCR